MQKLVFTDILKENGRIYFINRPLEMLVATDDTIVGIFKGEGESTELCALSSVGRTLKAIF